MLELAVHVFCAVPAQVDAFIGRQQISLITQIQLEKRCRFIHLLCLPKSYPEQQHLAYPWRLLQQSQPQFRSKPLQISMLKLPSHCGVRTPPAVSDSSWEVNPVILIQCNAHFPWSRIPGNGGLQCPSSHVTKKGPLLDGLDEKVQVLTVTSSKLSMSVSGPTS